MAWGRHAAGSQRWDEQSALKRKAMLDESDKHEQPECIVN